MESDTDASPALKASIELILLVVVLLALRLALNSGNSSIPPSKDSNRKKSPSKPSDNKANHMLFVNKRLRKAANSYVEVRLKRKHMISGDIKQFRGLLPQMSLVLAEGGKKYSLKKKVRTNKEGETVEYWAADTLQEAFTNWCKSTGLGGELSSHCGRKTFGSRLAKNKYTSQEDVIATLLRHNENGTIYHYVEESTGVLRALNSMYETL